GRIGVKFELLVRTVRPEREADVGGGDVRLAPAGDERVVLPMLEIAYEGRRMTEPQHEAAVLEGDRGVAVQVVTVRPAVSRKRERRSGERVARACSGAHDRIRRRAPQLLGLGE